MMFLFFCFTAFDVLCRFSVSWARDGLKNGVPPISIDHHFFMTQ